MLDCSEVQLICLNAPTCQCRGTETLHGPTSKNAERRQHIQCERTDLNEGDRTDLNEGDRKDLNEGDQRPKQ